MMRDGVGKRKFGAGRKGAARRCNHQGPSKERMRHNNQPIKGSKVDQWEVKWDKKKDQKVGGRVPREYPMQAENKTWAKVRARSRAMTNAITWTKSRPKAKISQKVGTKKIGTCHAEGIG